MCPFRAGVLCAAAVLPVASLARAAPPVLESTLGIRMLDARTEQALEGAVVVASEHYYWTAFHNSGTSCFRAAARRGGIQGDQPCESTHSGRLANSAGAHAGVR